MENVSTGHVNSTTMLHYLVEACSTVHVNSGPWLHCSVIPPHKKQQNCAFVNLRHNHNLWWVIPVIKLCFLLNQTTISVATGEPHPQPQYQIATKSRHNTDWNNLMTFFSLQTKTIELAFNNKMVFSMIYI
jgi:hypothetical protein